MKPLIRFIRIDQQSMKHLQWNQGRASSNYLF